MSDPVKIRVTREGNSAKYDLTVNGAKVCDLDYMDVLNLALNATSALRWNLPLNRSNG